MEVEKTILPKFIQAINHFEVPVYQRRYYWKEEWIARLLDDMISAGSNSQVKSHMLGTIVITSPNTSVNSGISTARVIDGQQRVISSVLIYKALSVYLREIGPIEVNLLGGGALNVSEQYILDTYVINKHLIGTSKYKAIPGESDRNDFLKIMEESFMHDDIKENDHMYSNYEMLLRYFRENKPDIKLILDGLSKIEVVAVKLTDGVDDPQVIFENLNSIGDSLSQIDLIRNDILLGLNEKQQKEVVDLFWRKLENIFPNSKRYKMEDFIKDYLVIQGYQCDSSLPLFKNFRHYKNDYLLVQDLNSFMNILLNHAEYYADCNEIERIKDKSIRKSLSGSPIFYDKILNSREFTFFLYSKYKQSKIKKKDFEDSMRLIESGMIRRIIMHGNAGNKAKEIFDFLLKDLPRKKDFFGAIRSHMTGVDKAGNELFPSDDDFRIEMKEKKLYEMGEICKYILYRLEMEKNPKEHLDFGNLTIEHIMPQTISSSLEWKDMLGSDFNRVHRQKLHTIGNLTLTGYNSELGNKTFEDKKTLGDGRGYQASRILMTREIADLPEWTEDRISERAEELVNLSLRIWPSLDDLKG